jgi:hypothetical protein
MAPLYLLNSDRGNSGFVVVKYNWVNIKWDDIIFKVKVFERGPVPSYP